MCGYDDFMMKMAADTDFVRAFFDKVLAIQIQVIDAYYGVLGPYLHLTTSGDDFGTQRGSFVSPAMFADLIAPYFFARISCTKQLANCYYWHHTCGAVARLLPQIIACGVDILNPVQTSAEGMDPEGLKAACGDSLVFWGAVDVQQLLPRATPHEVRQEVRRLIEVLGRDGGYVSAPAHEMQDDIPPENIVAWVETVNSAHA
jgi:uroporphyrinogen decarboxylase